MKKLRIGLTGGIASGKSVVSQLFKRQGVDVIDADQIARHLFVKDSPHLNGLRTHFGDAVFYANGELNRKALSERVFSSDNDLNWLNQYTHPLVNQQMKNQLASSLSDYVVLDIPLLIDKNGKIPSHLRSMTDRVLVIKVDINEQINRICARDSSSSEQAKKIIDSQSSLEQKLALADDVIDNNGTIESLESQVLVLHNQYLNMSHS